MSSLLKVDLNSLFILVSYMEFWIDQFRHVHSAQVWFTDEYVVHLYEL